MNHKIARIFLMTKQMNLYQFIKSTPSKQTSICNMMCKLQSHQRNKTKKDLEFEEQSEKLIMDAIREQANAN